MTGQVLQLVPKGGVSRTDIAAELRNMADCIEAGTVQADSAVLVVVEQPDLVPPLVYGYGNTMAGLYVAGALMAAANLIMTGAQRQ